MKQPTKLSLQSDNCKICLPLGSKAALFVATGCGLGRLPKAPGTFGTLWGVPLAYAISRLESPLNSIAIFTFIIFSIWIAHSAADLIGIKDPNIVVIDEAAGMLLALVGLPLNWSVIIFGFILFRYLDIVKPFLVGWLDRKLSGGLGIVADDLAAGIMANVVLRLGLFFLGR